MDKVINKTMDRNDLLTDEAKPVIQALNRLIIELYSKRIYMTSWYATLPKASQLGFNLCWIKNLIKRTCGEIKGEIGVGIDNRGPDYEPLPDSADDGRIPWYLYWESFWVIKNGPQLKNNMRLLDAGGTSSLFTCYLASLGCETHSIDINEKLVSNGNKIAKTMGWNMFSYAMNMKKLNFKDGYFDHAYSICVFEHLDYETRQLVLSEIARCLKPKGGLSITFDYRNPALGIDGCADTKEKNKIKTPEDIERNFLVTKDFELLGNKQFYDNMSSYLVHPQFDNAPYTFGAIFLKKRD